MDRRNQYFNSLKHHFSLAYRSGVTLATSSLAKPIYLGGPSSHLLSGLSVAFRTGASHAMEAGAIVQDVVALHVVVGKSHPLIPSTMSVSTQIATLRRLLQGWETTDQETGLWFRKAAEVGVPNLGVATLLTRIGCCTSHHRSGQRRHNGVFTYPED